MDYFKIRQINKDTYFLFEKKGVGQTLLIGGEKALLIDTGYGNPQLPDVVRGLTDKPLVVMNSHVHGDHCKGNGMFGSAFVGTADIPGPEKAADEILIEKMQTGIKEKWPVVQRPLNKMIEGFSRGRDATQYLPIPNRFDLGGRVIEIVPFPGHTPGGVLALDCERRDVYAGDAMNTMFFLFTNPTQKILPYSEQVRAFARRKEFDRLRISHSMEPLPFAFAAFFAGLLTRVDYNKSKKFNIPGLDEPLCVYAEPHPEYRRARVFYFPSQL